MRLTLLRRSQYVFWLAGILLCAISTGVYLKARYFQAMENRRLEDALRRNVRGVVPPAPAPRTYGERRAAWWAVWRFRG